MCSLYLSCRGLCAPSTSVVGVSVLHIPQLWGSMCFLYLSCRGLCAPYTSVVGVYVLPLPQLHESLCSIYLSIYAVLQYLGSRTETLTQHTFSHTSTLLYTQNGSTRPSRTLLETQLIYRNTEQEEAQTI